MTPRDWDDALIDLAHQRAQARALVDTALAAPMDDRHVIALMMLFCAHPATVVAHKLGDEPVTRQRAQQIVREALVRTLAAGGMPMRPDLTGVFRSQDDPAWVERIRAGMRKG